MADKTDFLCRFLLVATLAVVLVLVHGGEWGEWRDITYCDADPCGCPGYSDKCRKGNLMQLRICDMSDGTMCAGNQIRKTMCKAKPNERCPEWSEWEWASCNCETGNGKQERTCRHFKPSSQGCATDDELKKKDDRSVLIMDGDDCRILSGKCDALLRSTTTTTTEPTTTQLLPCCNVTAPVDDDEYAPGDIDHNNGGGGLLDRKRRDVSEEDFDYYLVDECRNCTAEEAYSP